MNIDNRKWSNEYIASNKGKLGAQIIMNELISNSWDMWFIGNTNGNSLYTVDLSNGEKVIVGFTTESIGYTYINKSSVRSGLYQNFGNSLVLVKFPLLKITQIMQNNLQIINQLMPGVLSSHVAPSPISTLIVNPIGKDFFVPLHAPLLAKKLLSEGNIKEHSIEKEPVFSMYKLDIDEDRYTPTEEEEEDTNTDII